MKLPLILFGVLLLLAFLVWLGLQIKIAPFPPYAPASGPVSTVPLPTGLPAPVERFYRQAYGDTIPVYNSVAISGTGTMAPFGLPFPMRFRLLYDRMTDYRSLITASFFGIPILTGDESTIEGVSIGRMPTGTDQGPWFDSGLNVRVWAEALNWFPAVLLTDGRPRWQPLDADTALLVVPFGGKEQTIVVRFDPGTGKVAYLEAMKYRKAGDLMLWVNGIWFDQGRQWIVLNIHETLFNVDVTAAIRQ